jgi:2-polyprenyl-3-methyl-5-hydroxy-6-metoxy-1,4-benzoquinol methylase
MPYDRSVTDMADSQLRDRLYGAYATDHAGRANVEASGLVYRRDIRPALPPAGAGPVVDIGCGQGQLVRLLLADGYNAEGVDVSAEQVAFAHSAGVHQVREGDYRDVFAQRVGQFTAVVATDLLEHLAKPEVLETFDLVTRALTPGGVFVARVPNAVSPFGGHIRHGDFTHESWFTERSIRQLAAAAGLVLVSVMPCPPIAHGLVSAARVIAWKGVSACYRLALAAETGVLRGHVVTQNLTFVARKPM